MAPSTARGLAVFALGLGLVALLAPGAHAAPPSSPSSHSLPSSSVPVNGTGPGTNSTGNATVASAPSPFTQVPTPAATPGTTPSVVPPADAVPAPSPTSPMVRATPGPHGTLLGLLLGAAALGLGPPRYLAQLLPLFSRLRQEEMLEHEVRRRIVGYVEAHPGVHYSGLRRALGLPNGTLSFHLRSLERSGFVRSRRVGVRLHFFVAGRVPDLPPEDTLVPPRVDILSYLVGHPGITQRELGRALNLIPSRVNYHVRALTTMGLVQVERQGRVTRCYARPSNGRREGSRTGFQGVSPATNGGQGLDGRQGQGEAAREI